MKMILVQKVNVTLQISHSTLSCNETAKVLNDLFSCNRWIKAYPNSSANENVSVSIVDNKFAQSLEACCSRRGLIVFIW